MKKLKKIKINFYLIILCRNIIIKKIIIILFFLFEFLSIYFQIQLRINKNKDNNYINNSIENNFAKYICKFLILEMNSNCLNDIYINNNFYDNLKDIKNNIRLSLKNINESKIENMIILIGLMPFIKGKSKIEYKIKNKDIYNYFKIFTNIKIKKNNIIILTNSDYQYFNGKFCQLFNFKWEFIPKNFILNHLRYIINHYYNSNCLNTFDKALNLNFDYYLRDKKFLLSSIKINDLFSKFII